MFNLYKDTLQVDLYDSMPGYNWFNCLGMIFLIFISTGISQQHGQKKIKSLFLSHFD